MKGNMLKGLWTTASLLVGVASASPVLALSTGDQIIGFPPAMGVFRITCPLGSSGLRAKVVSDYGSADSMRLTILKDGAVKGGAVGSVFEPPDPAAPYILLNGSGQYRVVIQLGIRGLDANYRADLSCVHSDTTIPAVSGSFVMTLDDDKTVNVVLNPKVALITNVGLNPNVLANP